MVTGQRNLQQCSHWHLLDENSGSPAGQDAQSHDPLYIEMEKRKSDDENRRYEHERMELEGSGKDILYLAGSWLCRHRQAKDSVDDTGDGEWAPGGAEHDADIGKQIRASQCTDQKCAG